MTISQDQKLALIQEKWVQHLARPLNSDFYTQDASLTFASTSAGASDLNGIKTFLKRNGSLSKFTFAESNDPDCKVILKNRMVTSQGALEEWIWSFVHDETMDWLIPGLAKPTNCKVTLPMVITAEFADTDFEQSGNMRFIKSKRVYWDQATLMRQIFLLPSDVKKLPINPAKPVQAKFLPVLTGTQMSRRILHENDPETSNLLLLSEHGTEAVTRTDVNQVNTPVTGSRPSTRVNSKYVGGKSTVFEHLNTDESKPKYDPSRFETHFSVSNESQNSSTTRIEKNVVLPGRKMSATDRNHTNFALSAEYQNGDQEAMIPSRKPVPYEKSEIKDHFESNNASANELSDELRKSRIQNHKDSNKSQIVFSGAEASPFKPRMHSNKALENNQTTFNLWESSSNGTGSMQSRPSSRVLAPPGGGSSLQLY